MNQESSSGWGRVGMNTALAVNESAVSVAIDGVQGIFTVPVGRARFVVGDGYAVLYNHQEFVQRFSVDPRYRDYIQQVADWLGSHYRPARSEVRVKTYRNVREYEGDAPRMAGEGWVPQGQSGQRGKINMGRTVGKAVVFLPWAIMRPSRKGDKITVTWVREA